MRDSRVGFGLQTSWPLPCPPLAIPIDHLLVTASVGVADRKVGPDGGSDHRAVVATLAF